MYRITTDTSSDLTTKQLEKLGLGQIPIGLNITTKKEVLAFPNDEEGLPGPDRFYELQSGATGTGTSALSHKLITGVWETILEAGYDVLHLGIAWDMSIGVTESVKKAMKELGEKYPERRIEAPNTYSISVALGFLLTRMVKLRDDGLDLDQMLDELDLAAKQTAHWFTVDDLGWLITGGRISGFSGYLGQMLNIKPLMRLPYGGVLEPVRKVRGSKKLLVALAEKVRDTIIDQSGEIWVAYGSIEQKSRAVELAEIVQQMLPSAEISFHRIGPIIGAHTGPSVIAIFFFANER